MKQVLPLIGKVVYGTRALGWGSAMKTLLIGMMVALLLVGCGGGDSQGNVDMEGTAPNEDALETAVEWSKLQDRSGVTYLPNTDKPFSGYAKRAYDTEQVEVLAEFDEGYVVRLQQWQENGTPRWDIGYMQGKVGGQDVPLDNFWESNSSCQDGLSTEWYENGQKGREENYKDGKAHGFAIGWYKNGQKKAEGNIRDDRKDGLWTYWHENGQKESEENYKDGGFLNGLLTEWYENGQKKSERNYRGGKLHGFATGWYENGQKRSEGNLKNGKLMSAFAWKPNGEKCPITNLKDGNGVAVQYKEDGTEKARATFKDGEIVED